jgi:hypothetical protein
MVKSCFSMETLVGAGAGWVGPLQRKFHTAVFYDHVDLIQSATWRAGTS